MRTVKLNAGEIKDLLRQSETDLGSASRTVHLFDEGEGLEIIMNYEGYGYKPISATIDFEYDENIRFSEGDD